MVTGCREVVCITKHKNKNLQWKPVLREKTESIRHLRKKRSDTCYTFKPLLWSLIVELVDIVVVSLGKTLQAIRGVPETFYVHCKVEKMVADESINSDVFMKLVSVCLRFALHSSFCNGLMASNCLSWFNPTPNIHNTALDGK